MDEPAPIPEIPISPLPAMETLFSENEAVPDVIDNTPNPPICTQANSADTSLAGTSANILNPTVRESGTESSMSNNEQEPTPPATVPTNSETTTTKTTDAPGKRQHHRPRGRPPGRARR